MPTNPASEIKLYEQMTDRNRELAVEALDKAAAAMHQNFWETARQELENAERFRKAADRAWMYLEEMRR